jgi:C4-dicarboxylate-specific signal transduction histidine kinase
MESSNPVKSPNPSPEAQIISSLLHSLRNGLSPITVGLDMAVQTLNQVSAENLLKALDELGSGSSSDSRVKSLEAYVRLAARKLCRNVESARAQIEGQIKNLTGVEKTLELKHHPTQGQSPQGALKLFKAVDSALGLVPKELRAVMEARIDPRLPECPPIRADRFLLIKVLVNLFNNAAQAILKTGRDRGLLSIRALTVDSEGNRFLHAEITDDGCGIPAERLPELFGGTPTGSEKDAANGLPWSAQAIRQMKGRIYADSPGQNRGATIHLELPVAG